MHDFLKLQDEVAVVWGGGAGMGEATVKQLVLAGCAVGVVDIDGALAENVAQAVIASTAIPGAFAPVRYKDFYLADGAISSNTPIKIANVMASR